MLKYKQYSSLTHARGLLRLLVKEMLYFCRKNEDKEKYMKLNFFSHHLKNPSDVTVMWLTKQVTYFLK